MYLTLYVSAKCPEVKVGYFGNDIKIETNVQRWQHCAMQCAKYSSCKFWTWRDNTKYCFLKDSDAGRTLSGASDAVSGNKSCRGKLLVFSGDANKIIL